MSQSAGRSWLFCVLTVALLPNCAWAEEESSGPRPIVLCSTTQIEDFTRQVVGDRLEVQCILSPGQDPHLYEATPSDAERVRQADICLENGLHLEGNNWMANLAKDENKPVITCTKGIEPIRLEVDGKSQPVSDPHSWFSPKNAAVYVRNITMAVSQLDPAHAGEYKSRASLYLDQLRTLDSWIKRELNAVPADSRVLVTSHDAFNYFCRDYGFRSQSPVGWSTGQEVGGGVTPARRQQTVESIRQAGVRAIFVESSVNPELIREIAKEAGVEIGGKLYSDSMGPPSSPGETYIGMMRENVITIVSSLVAYE
jgi:manganese/iron transport system substrate-binding protein